MNIDQAIFTSLNRRGGMSGYHLVSRSTGLTEPELRELATWSPSHGALLIDSSNTVSVNFHSLSTKRHALSRTCQGAPEYSGRGGYQLYTHILVFGPDLMDKAYGQAFSIYWDAMSLGLLLYQANPEPILRQVSLSRVFPNRSPEAWNRRAEILGLPALRPMLDDLEAGRSLNVVYPGDRLALAECLTGSLSSHMATRISFSTGLKPSTVRPYRLSLVNESVTSDSGMMMSMSGRNRL